MNRFENFISEIDHQISIRDEDRPIYAHDFDIIRNYLLRIMKNEDPVFKRIYAGPSLFGSFAENLRINTPDEFDVHFLLKLPYFEHIKLKRDNYRPGFVRLCLSKVLILMKNDPNHRIVHDQFRHLVNDWKYLCRNKLQNWLQEIVEAALQRYGCTVSNDNGTIYKLIYLKRGTAHTIKAISSERNISIDFVPAFKFDGRSDWLAERPFPRSVKEPLWFAVPKPIWGPAKKTRILTFSICVPQIEKHILTNRYNLKRSLRLFKSLRNKIGGYRLKSYFIKSLYLHENEKLDKEFWRQPTGRILIHMIDRLLDCLNNDCIPFYWCPDMNLIEYLSEDERSCLEEKFEGIKSLLSSYYHQPAIKLETVSCLFDTSRRPPLKKEYV